MVSVPRSPTLLHETPALLPRPLRRLRARAGAGRPPCAACCGCSFWACHADMKGFRGGCKAVARPPSQGIPRGFRARLQGIPRGFRGIPGDSAAIFGDSAPSSVVCQHILRRAQRSCACYRNVQGMHICWPPGRSPRHHRWVCTCLVGKPENFPEQPPFNILEGDRQPASELLVSPRAWPRARNRSRIQRYNFKQSWC